MKRAVFIIYFLTWFLLPCSPLYPSSNSDYAELYEQLFGQPYVPEYYNISVSVYSNYSYLGSTTVKTTVLNENNQLAKQDLISMFLPVLLEEEINILKQLDHENGYIGFTALTSLGYELELNKKKKILSITPPFTSLQDITISLSRTQNDSKYDDLSPSPFSTYLNILSNQSINHSQSTAWDPININLRGGLWFNSWIVQHEENVLGNTSDNPFFLQRLSLLKINKQSNLQFKAGSLDVSVVDYMSGSSTLWGMSINKLYSTHPQTRPKNNISEKITVTEKSRIFIYINDKAIVNYVLNQGKYIFDNIPISNDKNTITFKIVPLDHPENEHIISKTITRRDFMLPKGVHDYTFSVAQPYQEINRRYETTDGAELRGSYRFSYTESIELGLYSSIQTNSQILGIHTLFSPNIGIIKFNIGQSLGANTLTGYDLDYHSYRDNKGILNWNSSLRFRKNSLFSSNDGNSTYMENALSYRLKNTLTGYIGTIHKISESKKISNGAFTSISGKIGNQTIGARFSLLPESTSDRYTTIFNLNHSSTLTSRLSFNEFLTLKQSDSDDNYNWGFTFSYQLSPSKSINSNIKNDDGLYSKSYGFEFHEPQSPFTLFSTYSHNDTKQFQTNIAYQDNYTSFRTQLQASNSNDVIQDRRTMTYKNQYGAIDYSYYKTIDTDNEIEDTSSYRVETALVYAGGHFSFSRPITNGFILVHKDKSLDNSDITIASKIKLNNFQNGVINSISPYSYNSIKLIPTNLPIGYNLQKRSYNFIPDLYAGYVLEVGSDSSLTAIGELIDIYGDTINWASFTMTLIEDPTYIAPQLATYSSGDFMITKLKAGKYNVHDNNGEYLPFTLEIKAEKDYYLVELGQIMLQGEEFK